MLGLPIKQFENDLDIPRPCLKWAGGKTQLLPQLNEKLPTKLKANAIKRYVEPFVGGGAMYFNLYKFYDFQEVYLFDINPELVILYNVIKNNVEELVSELQTISDEYKSLDTEARNDYYYQARDIYNSFNRDIDANKYSKSFVMRAALTIFINRTCFNGLYRVNSKKLFNVPVGSYKNPRILDEDNLRATSKSLANATILQTDFADAEKYADNNTFIYYDPPYRPISKTSAFNAYSADSFDDNEQMRLKKTFDRCSKLGALQMQSNSDPTNYVADPFFDNLYKDYKICRVNASRLINADASKRGSIRELVITNY